MHKSILIDTCFLIKLLNDSDQLHQNEKDYFRHHILQGNTLWISTITIAEFCVRGDFDDIPFRNLKVLPFNVDHAVIAGKFMEIVYRQRNKVAGSRAIIPNDCKLFSQASYEEVDCFLTSDTSSEIIFNVIKSEATPKFDIHNINIPLHEYLGELGI
jgi:predicted nucleic acid-binding protein